MILLSLTPQPDFDDIFMKRTGLLPYVDFRPGYPPLGKFPYYFFYNLLSQTHGYVLCTFFFNLATLLFLGAILFLCISKLNPKKALRLALILIMMPSMIYLTIVYSRADALAIAVLLCAIYFIDSPWICGALISIGALIKLYPAILLIPLMIYYKGVKNRVKLLYSFALVFLVFSIPFLLSEPLMYTSVFLSHTSRGPSESIFSIIDGYYGHTGFLHPTFDAAIYSWQFAIIYNPSPYDHFRYVWNIPALPYISLGLQMVCLLGFSWIAKKRQDKKESIMLISLAIFSYFAFSTFYNPRIHSVQMPFLLLATLNWNLRRQIAMVVVFEVINIFHSLVWFTPIFWFTGTQLPLTIAVVTRTIMYIVVFSIFARSRKK